MLGLSGMGEKRHELIQRCQYEICIDAVINTFTCEGFGCSITVRMVIETLLTVQ